MDREFLNEISAVSDAGDESDAGNSDVAQWQTITLRADEQGCESKGKKRELPNRGRDREIFALTEPQRVDDQGKTGQPEPDHRVH